MHVQFFGAAGTVTGSNFLLSDDRGYGVLVDMGMFQGSEELESLNYQPIGFDAREVHSVFLTHAHLDHVGRMPILMKHGFSGKVYMTQATKEIAEVVLRDAAKIMQHDEEKPILYTEEDVFDLLDLAEVVSYGEVVDIGNIKATFRDAGHILGSASIEMELAKLDKRIVFSGDLGNSPEEIVRPTEMIGSSDVVVMESTYGDRNHPNDDPRHHIVKRNKRS
jgi:metallo-beta-lactamase family protein